MRVALGVFCKALLAELGIEVVSHVVRIGKVAVRSTRVPRPEDLEIVDASPVRCLDEVVADRMVAEIDRVRKARDTRRWRVRGDRVRVPAGARLPRPVRPQARRAPRAGAHEHPVGQGRGGGRRVRLGVQARLARARRDRDRPRRAAAQELALGRDRGRHEHGPADPGSGRDEALLHRAEAAGDGRPGDRDDRRSRSRSGPTSARSRPAGWWARPPSRSCWRRPCWRSSAATPSPRRAATSTRSWPGCRERAATCRT